MNRFLIHELNHTILVVDITPVGLPTEVYPPEGKNQELTAHRFQGWERAEEFLQGRGADLKLLGRTRDSLRESSVAVLTITG